MLNRHFWFTFFLLFSFWCAVQAVEELSGGKRRVSVTVDDTDEVLVYTPPNSWLSCRVGLDGCSDSVNASDLYDATWHELSGEEGQIRFDFMGSEVALYAASTDGTFDFIEGTKFQVDGVSYPATSGIFQASNLDESNHTLVLSSLPGLIRLDYLVYSYTDDITNPSPSGAAVHEENKRRTVVLAAVLGTILPLLAVAFIIGFIWLRRRRRRKRRKGRARSFNPAALVRKKLSSNRLTIDQPIPFTERNDQDGDANGGTEPENQSPLSPNRLVDGGPDAASHFLPATPSRIANTHERIRKWRSDLLAEPSFLQSPSPAFDRPGRIPTLSPTPLLTPYTPPAPARPPLVTVATAPLPSTRPLPPLNTNPSGSRPLPPRPSIDTTNVTRPPAVRAITTPILQQQQQPPPHNNPSRPPRGPRRFTVMNN